MDVVNRRESLLDQVTDHVLAHGLIGLSLRPAGDRVGTSDRMLIYHFGSRDGLVSAVVARTTERAIAVVEALPAAPERPVGGEPAVGGLPHRAAPRLPRLYCQAAATGLSGRSPTSATRAPATSGGPSRCATTSCAAVRPASRVARIMTLVDSALYGFHLDLTTDRPEELARGVDDLARAAQTIADPA